MSEFEKWMASHKYTATGHEIWDASRDAALAAVDKGIKTELSDEEYYRHPYQVASKCLNVIHRLREQKP